MYKRILSFIVFCISSIVFVSAIKAENSTPMKETFEIGKGKFQLNGEDFVIKAAELHYPRIPKEYWDHRIKMSKALGMNTICLYVFWNLHEENEGTFDFTGQKDLREFILLCQENDMKVILRPGPYVCAEWEMGGLPWWLLRNKDVKLRDNDPYFLEKVKKFEEEVASQVGDLTLENGGPIIMIQVENEYGAYGENKEYVANIRDILRNLYGENITLFQCDWSSNFQLNGLDDLLWTMNFGTGADIDNQFKALKELRPDSPLMCSEFWSGWFDKWGANHETRPAEEMIAGIDEMLSKDISFSLYMTHGGTNWGHWAGANSPGYSPDVTSYDYDAPIDESGRPTEKYYLLRETLAKYLPEGKNPVEIPVLPEPISIDKFKLSEVAPLFDNLPVAVEDSTIRTMEEYGMGYGSIMYSTLIGPMDKKSVLTIEEPHDFAQVFINGDLIGTLDRRKGETTIELPATNDSARLDILVEAMGRINFGEAIKDFKGITKRVVLSSDDKTEEISNWAVTLLPDRIDFYESFKYLPLEEFEERQSSSLPRGVYRGTFNVDKTGDTFLNFENWGKGLVYVNGYGIGRIWSEGPQQTLFMPGPWLKEGENEILIFDITGPQSVEVEGLNYPVIDKMNTSSTTREGDVDLQMNPDDFVLVKSGVFEEGNGWKETKFDNPVKTKYLALIIDSGYSQDGEISIAELHLLDEKGERLSREKWRLAADSYDSSSGNHNIDKIADLQESTYWTADTKSGFPHYIIIDLGEEKNLSGLHYLTRMETGGPGSIKSYRILQR